MVTEEGTSTAPLELGNTDLFVFVYALTSPRRNEEVLVCSTMDVARGFEGAYNKS